MFQDAEDEVGGALARANPIAMIHTDHVTANPLPALGIGLTGWEANILML
jgi:hypothetical protein